MRYKYGMGHRGFAPLCQPMNGLAAVSDGDKEYYNYLYYKRKLKEEEIRDYQLDYLGEE